MTKLTEAQKKQAAADRRAARRKLRANAGEPDATPIKDFRAQEGAEEPGSSPTAPPPTERKRARDVVIVACKIPNGLVLQNHRLVDGYEQVFGGGSRVVKVAEKIGNPITIIGPARAVNADPEAKRVIASFALTYNVPRDDFEQWMKDNAMLPFVKNKMIWAYDDEASVTDAARDLRGVRTGLEAINTEAKKPDGTYADPRMSKRIKRFKADDDQTTMQMRIGG